MRLAFSPSTSSVLPFVQSAFNPRTYLRTGGVVGVGDMSDPHSIAAVAEQGAITTGAILSGLAKLGTISGAFGPAAPIAAVVVGLVEVGFAIAKLFGGCGDTCVEATAIANQLQVYWQQNLDKYMQAPVHYYSLQQAALNNFMTGVDAMRKACGDPALGDAGRRCISERLDPNACAIKDDAGGCHNAWIDFYNPIKNDPNVVPDPVDSSSSGGLFSGTGGGGGFPMPLLLIGGGVLALTLMND